MKRTQQFESTKLFCDENWKINLCLSALSMQGSVICRILIIEAKRQFYIIKEMFHKLPIHKLNVNVKHFDFELFQWQSNDVCLQFLFSVLWVTPYDTF